MPRRAQKNVCLFPDEKKFRAASHVYGPVPSRRLGFSLGVDILPYKTCSFDCVYCQLGRTGRKSGRRGRYFSSRDILRQIKEAIAKNPRIDHITFSGSGEPTLHAGIGDLIRKIKKMTDIPVVVLTNSSLLTRKLVRQALMAADIVVPSLDAATAASFRRVNRPLPSVRVEDIIAALALFRHEFIGRIWLEVMLVKGINDSPSDIQALKRAIERIQPDKVQLNTVVRPPAEKWAQPLSPRALNKIKKDLGGRAQVVVDFRSRPGSPAVLDIRRAILSMAERRPVTLEDIISSLGRKEQEIRLHLETLLRWQRISRQKHGGTIYYALPPASMRKNIPPRGSGRDSKNS
jgi:wyosine [tRNA(Phe)-imidazoG37] synthetase (radical SAM superfamily)